MVVELWWYYVDIVLFPRVAMFVSIVFAFVDIQNVLVVVVSFRQFYFAVSLFAIILPQKPLLILTLMSTLTASYGSKNCKWKFVLLGIKIAKDINAEK